MIQKKIIFTYGVYDVLNLFARDLADGFEGYEIYFFDVSNVQEAMQGLFQFIQIPGKLEAVIGFNNVGTNVVINGVSIWQQLGIPFVDIIVDHPVYYDSFFQNRNTLPSAVLAIDKEHAAFLAQYITEIPISAFLPHGGSFPTEEPKKVDERSIDIFYAGGNRNLHDYKTNNVPCFGYPFDYEDMLDEVYARIMGNPSLTALSASREIFAEKDIVMPDEMFRGFIRNCVYVEAKALTEYRLEVLRRLAEAGFSITLCGGGWDDTVLTSYDNIKFEGYVSPERVLDYMADAKIVLNNMAWFREGSHERVFNAMLAKAVCVSDRTSYLQESFQELKKDNVEQAQIVLYDLNNLDELVEDVKMLLDSPAVMQTIAENGHREAEKNHTWKSRAQEIIHDLLPCFE